MNNIIQEDSILRTKSGIDITKLQLSAQEGFLLSRIDGKIKLKEIYQLSMIDKDSTAMIIKKLIDNKVIEIVSAPEEKPDDSPKRIIPIPERDYGDFIFNLIELQEDVEIPDELKKEILYVYANLGTMTKYELLALDSSANENEIKKAFFKLSKLYHPDNYFRKNLGAFKSKISAIYGALVEANNLFANKVRAQEYRRNLIEDGIIEALPGDILEDPATRKRRLEKESKKRRTKRNPMMERVKKAREFYDAALKNMEEEAWISAANNFRLAIVYDPNNELYKLKMETVQDAANKATAERVYQRALVMESYGQDGYFEAFIKAAEIYSQGAEYNIKVANLYCDQADWRLALPYAKKAVNSQPKMTEYGLLLSRIYLKLKDKGKAAKQLENILRQEPGNVAAKEYLKEAKKWF